MSLFRKRIDFPAKEKNEENEVDYNLPEVEKRITSIEDENQLRDAIITPFGSISEKPVVIIDHVSNQPKLVYKKLPFKEAFTRDITTANLTYPEKKATAQIFSLISLLYYLTIEKGIDLAPSIDFFTHHVYSIANVSKGMAGWGSTLAITSREVQVAEEYSREEEENNQKNKNWKAF